MSELSDAAYEYAVTSRRLQELLDARSSAKHRISNAPNAIAHGEALVSLTITEGYIAAADADNRVALARYVEAGGRT